MIEFQEKFQLFNTPGEVKSECNSILIINTGTAQAILNGLVLNANDNYSSNGNINEINKTSYRLAFQGIGTTEVLVVRKFYNK
jgi:hypothetical protein